MNKMNRITLEALSILKCVLEDQLEERYAYRNEVRRLTLGGLSLSFASLEHFLDRYGYLSIDHRSDSLTLTSSGIEAARHRENRLRSINDDILFHFSKELQSGVHADAPLHVSTGKRFDQHYIRFEGIGRGGLGSVWRAEHLKSGRPVAIKTLEGIDEMITSGRKSTLKKRLERVVRQVAMLSHPFICPILDLSVHHTPPYYVMPLYNGGSLRDLLRLGPMPPEVALNLFNQICLGLNHAHQKGVLHLDLKPENILLDDQGNVRIFDFGMSRTLAKQVAQLGRQSYIGLGSVAYMAPELLRDAQLESVSVDIYGLGLILYEILIGELPGRRSPMPSEVIEGLPEPIDELFDLMTQDRASQRPQSMDEVLEILNQVSPFDRVSSQSMVMTYHHPPLELPGLQSYDLPELEQAIDIQRELKNEKKRDRIEGTDRLAGHSSSTSTEQTEHNQEDTHLSTQEDAAQTDSASSHSIEALVDTSLTRSEDSEVQATDSTLAPSLGRELGQALDQALDQSSNASSIPSPTSSTTADQDSINSLQEPTEDHLNQSHPQEISEHDLDVSNTTPTAGLSPLSTHIASMESDNAALSPSMLIPTPANAENQALTYRLNQSTEVISQRSTGSQIDEPGLGIEADFLRTPTDLSELEELRDGVLEELEELEESSLDGVLSSAPTQGYDHLRSNVSTPPPHHGDLIQPAHATPMPSPYLPDSSFEDEEKTELKPVESSEPLHEWPPRSPSPQPRPSVAQQLLDRQKRGRST